MSYHLTTSQGVLTVSLAGEAVQLFPSNVKRSALYIFNKTANGVLNFFSAQSLDEPNLLFTMLAGETRHFFIVDYGTALQVPIWFGGGGGTLVVEAVEYSDVQ